MYIFQEAMTHNGALATAHRVAKIEITDVIRVTINSFANETSEMLIWQDVHECPFEAVQSGTLPQNIYDWVVSDAGPFPTGAQIADAPELDKQRAKLKSTINTLRDRKIAEGCTTPSGRVDTDEVSLRNIMGTYQGAVLSLVAQEPFSVDWRMADNTLVTLDAAAMIAVGNAVLLKTKLCYERSWTLKEEVDQADETTLLTIDLTQGWPE